MSDSRQNFTFTADTSDAEAKIANLRAQLAALQQTQAQFANNPVTAAGLQNQIKTVSDEIDKLQPKFDNFSNLLVRDFAQVEGASMRLTGALKGTFTGAISATDMWSQRQVDAASKTRVFTQTIQQAIASHVGLVQSLKQNEQIAAQFGKVVKSSTDEAGGSFLNFAQVARHSMALFDEGMRGSRAQMVATVGAMTRDSGLLEKAISAVGSAGFGAVAGIAALAGGLVALASRAIQAETALRGVYNAALLQGRAAAQVELNTTAMAESIQHSGMLGYGSALTLSAGIQRISHISAEARGNISDVAEALSKIHFEGDIAKTAKALETVFSSTGHMKSFVEENDLLTGSMKRQFDAAVAAGNSDAASTLAAGGLKARLGNASEDLATARKQWELTQGVGMAGEYVPPQAFMPPGTNLRFREGSQAPSAQERQLAVDVEKGNHEYDKRIELQRKLSEINRALGKSGAPATITDVDGIKRATAAATEYAAELDSLASAASRMAMTQIQEKVREAGMRASINGAANERSMRQGVLKAEIAELNVGLQSVEINEKQKLELRSEVAQKTIALNQSLAGSNARASKLDYQAFVREEENKLKEFKGNRDRQLQILVEWTAKARELYVNDATALRGALAQIEAARIQVNKQSVDEQLASFRQQYSQMEARIREFEYNTQARVKVKDISPVTGFQLDVNKIEDEYSTLAGRVKEVMGGADFATPAERQKAQELFDFITLRGRAAAADYREKMVAANEAIIEKFAAPWKSLFSGVATSLENAIGGVLSRSTTVKSALDNLVKTGISGTINAIGTTLSQVAAKSIFHAVSGQTLTDLASKAVSEGIGKLFNVGTTAATEAPQIAALAANTISVDAAAAAQVVNTLSLDALTGAVIANSITQFNPEVAGFKLSGGGIIPSAAGGMMVGGGSDGSIAIVHPREMVLPASISQGIQNMISRGEGGGTSNVTGTVNYSPTVNGVSRLDKRMMTSMMRDHGPMLADLVRQAMR